MAESRSPDRKAIVSTFGETVTSSQLDAFHRSGISIPNQNTLDRRIRNFVKSEDIQPEAILLPKMPMFDVSKRKPAGGISFDVECIPGVYPNTVSKEEIDEVCEKASGQKVTSAQIYQRMLKDMNYCECLPYPDLTPPSMARRVVTENEFLGGNQDIMNDSEKPSHSDTVIPLPLPEPIKKKMLGALTLGMSAETVIKTLLQIVIDNQARGVNIDCYTEDVEDLEKFSKGAAKFLESPNNEGGAGGFGFKFGRLASGLVEHLNGIKLSTTATELNRDLVSRLTAREGKITPELIIAVGFIVRQYRQYLDLVEELFRDFFYVIDKDSSGEVSEEEDLNEKPYLHYQESLVMGMQALVISYNPEEET